MPVLLAGALLLPQAASAFDTSMTLKANGEDIEGCSTITSNDRENTIPILAMSQAVQVAYDPAAGAGGGATGNRIHAPLQVRIAGSCGSTPLLYKALVQNEVVEATIKFYEPDPSGSGETRHGFTIELAQARIVALTMVGVSDSGREPGGVGDLLMSIAYGQITWTYEPTGITHEDRWGEAH